MVSSQICQIKSEDLQQFLLKYPTISIKILSELANRLESAKKQTDNVATEKVETRIAMYLVDCLESEQSSSNTIELPMSKKRPCFLPRNNAGNVKSEITRIRKIGIH